MSGRFKVIVCRGPECGDKRNSKVVHAAIHAALTSRGLAGVELAWQSCFGRCTQGPNVLVTEVAAAAMPRFSFATLPTGRPGRSALYNGCTPDDAGEIIDAHVVGGALVRRLIQPVSAPARAADPSPAPPPASDPEPES